MASARAARLAVAFVLLCGATAACSLLVSVDGLSGGTAPDGGGREEAAVPFDGGADGEARADGATSPCDGGACALPDAGTAPDATAGFCASRTPADFFCADFDGTDFLVPWTATFLSGGSAEPDDGGSTSPPFSLLTSVVRDGGTFPIAGVFKTFTQTVAAFHLELDVEPLGATEFQYVQLGLGSYALTLGTEISGTQFVEEDVTYGDGGTARMLHPFTAPWTPVWHHVVVDAVLTAPATVDVHFDGAAVLTAEPLLYSAGASSQGKLRVGQIFVEPGVYATRFDNVVFAPR